MGHPTNVRGLTMLWLIVFAAVAGALGSEIVRAWRGRSRPSDTPPLPVVDWEGW